MGDHNGFGLGWSLVQTEILAGLIFVWHGGWQLPFQPKQAAIQNLRFAMTPFGAGCGRPRMGPSWANFLVQLLVGVTIGVAATFVWSDEYFDPERLLIALVFLEVANLSMKFWFWQLNEYGAETSVSRILLATLGLGSIGVTEGMIIWELVERGRHENADERHGDEGTRLWKSISAVVLIGVSAGLWNFWEIVSEWSLVTSPLNETMARELTPSPDDFAAVAAVAIEDEEEDEDTAGPAPRETLGLLLAGPRPVTKKRPSTLTSHHRQPIFNMLAAAQDPKD